MECVRPREPSSWLARSRRRSNSIESALAIGTTFEPAHANRSFTLMLSDIGEITYLPRLIQHVQHEAPGIGLSVKRLVRTRLWEELRSGSVDLALGWVARVHDEVGQRRLFDESFVCILRPNHPRVGRKLSLKQFASEWHLLVGRYDDASENFFRSLDGDLERQLTQRGITRKVAMRVPHFLGPQRHCQYRPVVRRAAPACGGLRSAEPGPIRSPARPKRKLPRLAVLAQALRARPRKPLAARDDPRAVWRGRAIIMCMTA